MTPTRWIWRPDLLLQQMIERIERDTQLADQEQIVGKLNAAQDWIFNRVLPMNRELLKVTDDENTMASDTRSYDLAANVATGVLYEIQWLGVKYTSDTVFVPVEFCGGSSPNFIYWDQQTVKAVHPQWVVIDNFNQVRFAPGLPSGTIIRTDYIYKPRQLSIASKTDCDLPEVFHEAMVSEATARCFLGIDDTREGTFRREALDALYGAQNVLKQRQFQTPPRTRPSMRRGRMVY